MASNHLVFYVKLYVKPERALEWLSWRTVSSRLWYQLLRYRRTAVLVV